jgi:hypothetical protein
MLFKDILTVFVIYSQNIELLFPVSYGFVGLINKSDANDAFISSFHEAVSFNAL